MKFSSTVDSLSRENRYLRGAIALLAIGVILSGLGVLLLYDKAPALVERSSRGLELVSLIPLRRTQSDLEQVIRLMIKARLDTDSFSPDIFLSDRQLELRTAEQKDLKARGLSQVIFVRTIKMGNGTANADIDRLISMGDVRSAVKANVDLMFQEIQPNELNPYGLKLALLTPIDQKPGVLPVGAANNSQRAEHEGSK